MLASMQGKQTEKGEGGITIFYKILRPAKVPNACRNIPLEMPFLPNNKTRNSKILTYADAVKEYGTVRFLLTE